MTRYIIELGERMQFEAKNTNEIVLNLKKALNREYEDDKTFLLTFASRVRGWNNVTINTKCNCSFVQSIKKTNLLTELCNQDKEQKTTYLSQWIENGFGNIKFGKLSSFQLNLLDKLTLKLRKVADNLNDHTISEIFNYNNEGYHNSKEYNLLTNKQHLIPFFLLNFIMHTVSEETKTDCSSTLHTSIYTEFQELLSQYAIMWQFTLNQPMDINFMRSGLNYLADILDKHPLHRFDMISDYLPSCKVSPGAKLYFAYGSNMDHKQMKARCPSAKFIGCESLKNFEYYIDRRGVASLKPKYGAIASGTIWDIQDSSDWEVLDHYEGVKSGIYQRHAINTKIFGHLKTFQIYISNTLKEGNPRPGYQENIIESLVSLESGYKKEISGMNKINKELSMELGLDNYDYPFKLWKTEMTNWLGSKNV